MFFQSMFSISIEIDWQRIAKRKSRNMLFKKLFDILKLFRINLIFEDGQQIVFNEILNPFYLQFTILKNIEKIFIF